MCGIIGYIGNQEKSKEVLIKGLENLEYRGYDSSGVALKENNQIQLIKSSGRIENLKKKLKNKKNTKLGIGHTRWATHGIANETNAHPHKVGKVTLVHNGIIENYEQLKKDYLKEYKLKSETDTEVICAVIDKIYKENNDKLKTLKKINKLIKGSYAFGIIFDDEEKLYAMRKDSPLIIGYNEQEKFIASDVPAILEFTNKYVLLDKDEYAVLESDKLTIYDNDLKEKEKKILTYEGNKEIAMKNGYKHFMIKEINEEPAAFANMLGQFDTTNIETLISSMPDFSKYEKIDIVGCGSAYHAGLIGKSIIEEYCNIKVDVEIASEYRYKKVVIDEKTLTVLISQSGETADTLAALRKVKEKGYDTLGIINTVGSSIAREADNVLYIKTGSEISVATTKAYSAQVLMLILIALNIGTIKKEITNSHANEILKSIKNLSKDIEEIIKKEKYCIQIAKKIYKKENMFFIGRKIDYALCMEGSLKLKEITYIHSESYAAGELKHGTISLIEENTPIIAIVTDETIASKTISNIKETKARGANISLITTDKIYEKYCSPDLCDNKIIIKNNNDFINPLLVATNLQLLAYHVALLKKLDIDKPRNLAKSVTVE